MNRRRDRIGFPLGYLYLLIAFSSLVGSGCSGSPLSFLLVGKVNRVIENSTLPLNVKWVFSAPTATEMPPLIADGLVLIRTDRLFIAVDPKTGKQLWQVQVNGFHYPPGHLGIQENILVFLADNNHVMKTVNPQNGTVMWTQSTDGTLGLIHTLAIDRDRVYIGLVRETIPLYAYRLSDGKQVWQSARSLPSGISPNGLFVKDRELYVFLAGNLYILDPESGVVKRTLNDFSGEGVAPWLVGNDVYLWLKGTLLVKSSQTGHIVWQADVRPDFYDIIGQYVYVGSVCCTLSKLDNTTGKVVWQRKLVAEPESDPVAIEGNGYMMLRNGSIIGFDLETGEDRGTLQTNPPAVNPKVPSHGLSTDGSLLYATFGDNKVFAFGK